MLIFKINFILYLFDAIHCAYQLQDVVDLVVTRCCAGQDDLTALNFNIETATDTSEV